VAEKKGNEGYNPAKGEYEDLVDKKGGGGHGHGGMDDMY
jgi:hypothetical protein